MGSYGMDYKIWVLRNWGNGLEIWEQDCSCFAASASFSGWSGNWEMGGTSGAAQQSICV